MKPVIYGEVEELTHVQATTDEIYNQLQSIMNFNARENYDLAINTIKFDSSLRKMRCCKGIPAEQWRLLYFMHVVKKQFSFRKKYDEDRFKHAS